MSKTEKKAAGRKSATKQRKSPRKALPQENPMGVIGFALGFDSPEMATGSGLELEHEDFVDCDAPGADTSETGFEFAKGSPEAIAQAWLYCRTKQRATAIAGIKNGRQSGEERSLRQNLIAALAEIED